MALSPPYKDLKKLFVGTDIQLPTVNGMLTHYINFDNAASTPSFVSVRDGVNSFLNYYSSVHRGTGYKSQLSTWAYERARDRVIEFVSADPAKDVCIFGKNTTEAINKLSKRYPLKSDSVILTSMMEHHSNDLPFRNVAKVVHVGVRQDGSLDEGDFDRDLSHFLIAAILGHEWGIGVRNGCFCAHPYILQLLGVSPAEAERVRREIEAGNKRDMPGLVRVSFGLYNTKNEIDVLVDALEAIIRGDIKGKYIQDPSTGEYSPENWEPRFEEFFEL